MSRLVLIKHSQPELVPEVPSPRWVLSDAGRQRCVWLARSLRALGVTRLAASLEPKALETAALVAAANGLTVAPHAGLLENDRSGQGFLPEAELLARIRRFYAEPDTCVMGRETANAAFARFAAAIGEVTIAAPEEATAVVTHGTVLTLFVSRHNAHVVPFDLWSALKTPSFVVLEPRTYAFDDKVHDFAAPG